MKKLFYTTLSVCLAFIGSHALAAVPYFTAGHLIAASVCENASSLSLNASLAVLDTDAGDVVSISLVSGPAHGTASISFSTTSSGAAITPTGLTYTPATSFSGNDTLFVSVSDGTDADTAIVVITVNPLPVAGTITGSATVCTGSTVALASSVSGGSWSISNAHASITGSGMVTGITPGLDTVGYVVVNGCGVAIARHIVTVIAPPTAGTLTGPAGMCLGDSTTLSPGVSGGTWGATNTTASVTGGLVHAVATGTDTIFYAITNLCGSDTARHTITISIMPVVSAIAGAATLCEAALITLTDSTAGGTWSSTTARATVSGGMVTGISAGADTIVYTVTNSCGSVSVLHAIAINPLPVAGTLSGPASVCLGDTVTISASVAGGTWGATNTHALLADSMASGHTAGLDTISYAVTNGCGTIAATHLLQVLAAPAASPISGAHRLCTGGTTTLSAPATGGTWAATTGNVSLAGSVATGNSYGQDTIVYIATNACGTDTGYFAIMVDTAAPATAGTVTGTPVLCTGDTATYLATVTGGSWAVTGSYVATISASGRVFATHAGTDSVIYTVSNGCGSVTDTAVFTVNALPVAGAISGYDSVCAGSVITLSASPSGGIWYSTDNVSADVDATGHVSGYLHGSTTILYIVSNSCGSDTSIKNINVNVPAQPIMGSSTVCQFQPGILIEAIPGGTWSSSNFLVAPIVGGTVFGLTLGTATITYTLRNACGTSVETFDVTVIDCSNVAVPDTKPAARDISIFPNPNDGTFSVLINGATHKTAQVTVVNTVGEVISTNTIATGRQQPLSINAPAGIYFLKVTEGEQQSVFRLVIQ
jgi:hypothetical protein